MDLMIDTIDKQAAEIARLKSEVERFKNAIRKHRDQKGDDRCWLDDLDLYSMLDDGEPVDFSLPPKEEFLKSCERFYCQRQNPAAQTHPLPLGCRTIGQLESLVRRFEGDPDDGGIDRLREANAKMLAVLHEVQAWLRSESLRHSALATKVADAIREGAKHQDHQEMNHGDLSGDAQGML